MSTTTEARRPPPTENDAPEDAWISRRGLLGLAGAAAFLTAGRRRRPCPPERTVAVAGKQVCSNTDDPHRHLANRLTFGATQDLVDEIDTLTVDGFINQQLDPDSIDDSALDAMLSGYQTLEQDYTVLFPAYANSPTILYEHQHAALLRAVYSRRQLFEVMADFWTNHFNTDFFRTIYWKPAHERDVIRAHALGKFKDMLAACAQSPAMIFYLDVDHNLGAAPNQNFARELLELHTVSLDAGYTETDVTNASLVFTGWNVDAQGQFTFLSNHHWVGPVTVMGWSTAGTGGVADGLSLLDYLAHHPNTAHHIARKLCVRFVGDDPPATLVNNAAQVYLDNDTSIAPVIRYIFENGFFWQSAGTKLRRPFDVVAAMLRAVDATIDSDPNGSAADTMRIWLERMGHPLLLWPAPDGYPESPDYWLTTDGVVRRWEFAKLLAAGDLAGVGIQTLFLVDNPFFMTNEEWVQQLQERLLGWNPHQATLEAHMNSLPGAPLQNKIDELVGLILASPDFQER